MSGSTPEWHSFSCAGPGCYKFDREVKLRACSRCHTVTYCSKECQRADWQNHKELCHETYRLGQMPAFSAQIEHLNAWTNHNDNILLNVTVSAMNVSINPDARKTFVLYLRLSYHPEETRRSKKFRLAAFGRYTWETLLSLGFTEAAVSVIQADRRAHEEKHRHSGRSLGVAMAVLDACAARVFTAVPYAFPTDAVPPHLEEWDSVLQKIIDGQGA